MAEYGADQPSTDDQTKKRTRSDKKSILKEARDRFELVYEADRENKEAAKEDTRFVYVAGAQWPDKIAKARRESDEAVLEFPQLKQFVKQVVNDQRQNRPGIRVHPAGSDASKEVAELLQGLIRGIEYESNAEAAYDTGFEHAVVGGRGYWRIFSKYVKPDGFEQRLCISRIADPSTVWLDPDYQEPDGSDRNFGYVTEHVTQEEFKERWPNAKPLSWTPGNSSPLWYPGGEKVLVADYYRRVCDDDTLLMLSDGTTAYLSDLPAGTALPPGVTVQDQRPTERYRVEWFKIAGGEQILEEYPWPGTIIPVICCPGDEVIIDGKRHFYGLIRQAKDAQRMYNYRRSAEAMRYALAPKAPWVGPADAFAGYEKEWETANSKPHAFLPYNHLDEKGQPIPQPQRTMPVPVEAGWAESAQQDKQDMRSVIGMYENSLGMLGQEVSGRAILAREKQGDNSTFHFVDNLSRAIALTGRILVELIPDYYDTQRMVTLVGVDDARTQQVINEPQPAPGPDGAITAILKNNVTEGEYAVTVEAGPSYATKRQEMSETMLQLVQSFPPLMQMAGDLVIGSMDFADSDAIAERLKVMLPQPVQQMLAAKEQGQDPQVAAMAQQMEQFKAQVQQAMTGMQQQLQSAMAENQQLKQQAAVKADQAASDQNIEQIKAYTAEIKANADIFKALVPLLQTIAAPQLAQDAQILAPAANQAASTLNQQ